jgi:ABC-2 type transport system ATP-binding protein
MIKINKLSKSFQNVNALAHVSFKVSRGELCGLLGPNGAGKSTLFKILMGLLESDAGQISIQNQAIQYGDYHYKQNLGYAPENPVLYEYLTGYEFLKFVAEAKNLPLQRQDAEINHWLTFFKMPEKANELITNYSNGMRRKISLSAALLGRPSILLLDEATNGLDPESSYQLKCHFQTFCQSGGTVVFSSHIIETVEKLCDRVIILHQGQVLKELNREQWQPLQKDGQTLEQIFINLIRRSS